VTFHSTRWLLVPGPVYYTFDPIEDVTCGCGMISWEPGTVVIIFFSFRGLGVKWMSYSLQSR
jgi:hypothetical protein